MKKWPVFKTKPQPTVPRPTIERLDSLLTGPVLCHETGDIIFLKSEKYLYGGQRDTSRRAKAMWTKKWSQL